MFSELLSGNKGGKREIVGSSWKHAVHCVILRCMESLFSQMGFSHMQVFSTPNIVTTTIMLFILEKGEYHVIPSYTGETNEVIEDGVSEALMPDHSLAIKHFVRRFQEVLSTRLIQLVRLISH